jgi:hypothetical protein
MTPVMVIIIEPELELDDVEPPEAPTSIGGGLSLLASSADPCEKAPAMTVGISNHAWIVEEAV